MTWWSKPDDKAPVWWEYKAGVYEPPRGDFEQRIVEALAPIFDRAREHALVALTEGDQFDEATLRDDLLALFLPALTDAAIFAFNDLETRLALGFEPGDVELEAREWARQKAEALVDQLINTTRGWLSGLSPEEVEAALDRAFGALRREVIGATEVTGALAAGALIFQRLAAAIGVKVELIWYTREDELVCEEICEPLHGKPQEVWGAQFPDGPPAHVKCRCGVRAVVRRRQE